MSLSRLLGKDPYAIRNISDNELESMFTEKVLMNNRCIDKPETLSLAKPISVGVVAGSAVYLLLHMFK